MQNISLNKYNDSLAQTLDKSDDFESLVISEPLAEENDDRMTLPGHLAFFGLSKEPFRLTPNRKFFFRSSGHASVLEVVRYGIREGEGFIIVIGEVGTGKTLLLRMLLPEFKERHETALILSPLLSPKELLQAILVDVGQEPSPNSNIEALLRELNTYLFDLAKANKKLAIIIDEAQNLPDETIEQLRLLSNFESDQQKLLQIVLVGQPELKEKLNQPNLRQLQQRVTIMERLPPLGAGEMLEYVRFRMAQAGRNDIVLTTWAQKYLRRKTGGIPRQINRLMGRALLVAYAQHSSTIDTAILRHASASMNLDNASDKTSSTALWWALIVLAVLTIIVFLYSFGPLFLKNLFPGITLPL